MYQVTNVITKHLKLRLVDKPDLCCQRGASLDMRLAKRKQLILSGEGILIPVLSTNESYASFMFALTL